MKYYLYNGSEQQGPFDITELKSKKITTKTPVWYEGLPEWKEAGEILELKELFIVAIPPPIKKESPPSVKVSAKKSTLKKVLMIVSILVISLIGIFIYNALSSQEQANHEQSQKDFIKQNITQFVTAEGGTYNYSELGGISNFTVSINNTTSYLIDNVRVKIKYIKTDGDLYKNEYLDFDLLAPNSKMTLNAPSSNRGTKVEYEIESIKSNVLGLY